MLVWLNVANQSPKYRDCKEGGVGGTILGESAHVVEAGREKDGHQG